MNIHISNLDLELSNSALASIFTPFGQVESATIAIDSFTDKSRGFGHVQMPDEKEAATAIQALNKTVINGREVEVHEVAVKTIQKGSYKVGDPSIRTYEFRKN